MKSQATSSLPRIHTWTWFVFVFFSVLLVIYGVYAITLPSMQPAHWDDLTSDPEVVDYIAGNFRWLGMLSLGFGVVTIGLAYTGYRKNERGAWYAFVYFPIFFVLAIAFTWPGIAWLPCVILSLAVLLAPLSSMFRNQERPNEDG